MSGYIADENFPYPSFEFLLSNGIDIIHVGTQFPSIADYDVIEIAVKENRLLITLDRDHGELIFTGTVDRRAASYTFAYLVIALHIWVKYCLT